MEGDNNNKAQQSKNVIQSEVCLLLAKTDMTGCKVSGATSAVDFVRGRGGNDEAWAVGGVAQRVSPHRK